MKATGLFSTNYLPPLPNPEPAVYAAYRSDTLDLPSGVESTSSRFAITNMVLGNHELAIRHPSGVAKLTRADGYPDSVRRLRTVKGIDVTAWLEIAGLDATSRDAAADDICYLLSLARGTKIQWISRIDYSSEGVEVHRHHSSRITKAYCPLPVIDPRELSDTAAFLETSLPIYLAQRDKWKLSRRLIDSYLDAKAEADYLQTRGVKLAVVMEMLKQTFLDATQQQGLVRSSPQFSAMAAKLKRAISTVLSAAGWNESERAVVYGKLRGLNRVPFQDLVLSLCAHLDLTLPEADVRLFVKCRNSLVHHGRFYCETAGVNPARSVQPHDRPVDEYFWLIHVLDRVFLRIVGYRGPYIDWSAAEHPVRRETF